MWLFSHFATWFNWLAVSYHFQRGGLGKGFKNTPKVTSFMDVPLRRSQFPWEKFLVFKRLSRNSFLFSVDIFTPGIKAFILALIINKGQRFRTSRPCNALYVLYITSIFYRLDWCAINSSRNWMMFVFFMGLQSDCQAQGGCQKTVTLIGPKARDKIFFQTKFSYAALNENATFFLTMKVVWKLK